MRPHNLDAGRVHYLSLVGRRSSGERSPTRESFLRQVRDCLSHLDDHVYLQRHPLAGLVGDSWGVRGSTPSRTLEVAVRDCLEALRQRPRTARLPELLQLRYVDGLDAAEVQQRLGLSRSAYFRAQWKAVELVAAHLSSVLLGGAEPPGASFGPDASSSADSASSTGSPDGAVPNNLPLQLTSLIGREEEMAEASRLFETTRLLTLTGPGGSGKTRLALELAHLSLDGSRRFGDGVFFVDLSPLTEPQLVIAAIARVLGIREASNQPLLHTVEQAMKTQSVLLVLDNFEHLVPAASEIAHLLSNCSGLTVLATSREPLRLRAEQEYIVQPLRLPDLKRLDAPDTLSHCPAVAFFIERVRRVRPDWELTAANARAVAELCVRLDGLPLALELAAARARVLSADATLQKLKARLELPGDAPRDLPARQKTLKATLDWSYGLLSDPERTLLRRLSVFAGGFSLEAVERVCATGLADGLEGGALGLLIGLSEKNLVRDLADESSEPLGPRYALLQTVREYALELLERSSELDIVQRRHAGYFLDFAETAEAGLLSPELERWLERLQLERDDLQAALGWALAAGEAEISLRIAGTLWEYWWGHGHWFEGLFWLEQALGKAEGASADARAKALHSAGYLLDVKGDHARARALLEESVLLCRETGNAMALSVSLSSLVLSTWIVGDLDRAAAHAREALAIAKATGDRFGTAYALRVSATVTYYQGDAVRATALADESIAISPDIANRAYGCLVRALIERDGDVVRAMGLSRECLEVFWTLGDKWGALHALANLAYVALCRGDPEPAIRLSGAAGALGRDIGVEIPAIEIGRFERALSELRVGIGEDTFARAWADGQAMTLDRAVEYALREIGEGEPRQEPKGKQAPPLAGAPGPSAEGATSRSRPPGLTRREGEVLRLLAQGRSNRGIAAELTISDSTVERHVANIFTKIGAHSRVEAANYATRNGLEALR